MHHAHIRNAEPLPAYKFPARRIRLWTLPYEYPTSTENAETNGACGADGTGSQVSVEGAFASVPRVVGKEPGFEEAVCDERGRVEESHPPGVQRRLIMRRCCRIRLWTAAVSCLKSQADRILANDTSSHGAWKPLFVRCGRSQKCDPPTTGPDGTEERLKLLPKILARQPRAVHQAQLVDASQFTLEALEQFLRGVIQV
jgi:hypothetical protein